MTGKTPLADKTERRENLDFLDLFDFFVQFLICLKNCISTGTGTLTVVYTLFLSEIITVPT
jgi:hypothetical protein